MNRRELLKGMLALPAIGTLGGCRFEREHSHHQSSDFTKLCVILQGPFGVVVQKDRGYSITAFVPALAPEDNLGQHELRLGSPAEAPPILCKNGYQFELLPKGLETARVEPHIDRGFDNVHLSVEKWAPSPDKYFVTLELPPPRAITYIPPLYPLLLESEDNPSRGRLGSAPLNQVLEYAVRDLDDVRLQLKHPEECEQKGANYGRDHERPLSTQEMLKRYRDYQDSMPDQAMDHGLSQRRYVDRWLAQYSHIYFFGVGLHPDPNPGRYWRENADHGVRFFNEKLLPSIYLNKPVPPGTKLIKVGRDVLPCSEGQSDSSSPSIRPSVWQYSMPQPHLETVASTENCTAPGAVVTVAQPSDPH